MKKIIALSFILLLCLSLCACAGTANLFAKYAGVYETEGFENEVLILNKDGTGTYDEYYNKEKESIEWKVDGKFIIITKYSQISTSSYEIRGSSLVDGNGNIFNMLPPSPQYAGTYTGRYGRMILNEDGTGTEDHYREPYDPIKWRIEGDYIIITYNLDDTPRESSYEIRGSGFVLGERDGNYCYLYRKDT